MRYAAIVMILLTVTPWVAAQTAPTTDASPRGVIDEVMREVLAIMRDPGLTTAQKETEVRAIADKRMDFETFSRLAMGRYWRELSETQRAEFVPAFREHVSATHWGLIDEYVDEEVNLTGDQQEERGDWTVQTLIIGTRDGRRRELAKVDYRLRQKQGDWKVIDVTVDGVSLVANFRSQFNELMPNGGIERVMKLLREKHVERRN
jgi:phospholipid transport system substrate-binding protein